MSVKTVRSFLRKLALHWLIATTAIGSSWQLLAQYEPGTPKTKRENRKSEAYEDDYRDILSRERRLTHRTYAIEGLISGIAATIIGTYGLYNDDRGILARVLYSATQTAGTITASHYVFLMQAPSLILETDALLRSKSELSYEEYQRLLVWTERQRARAAAAQLGYSSLVLAGLNGYNGYIEKNVGLRNVFYFLSFNFALVSLFSFVQQPSSEPTPRKSMEIGFVDGQPAIGLSWRLL
jgi:hypothetical protein